MENRRHTGSIVAHESSYETLETSTEWFIFFKFRDTTLKVYTLFLHNFTTEIHVDLILSAHGGKRG